MKHYLLAGLLLAAVPAMAQGSDIIIRHDALPALAYGAPLFSKADSTGAVAMILPAGKKCYVLSQNGPWYHVVYNTTHDYYTPAHTLAITGYPGHETASAFADANAMLLTTADDVDTAWQKMQQLLLGQGYAIAQSQKELHSFSTSPKALGSNAQLTISGVAQPSTTGQGTQILLSGSYSAIGQVLTVGALGGFASQAVNTTRQAVFQNKNAQDHLAFSAVEQMARTYPSAVIKYALR